MNPARENTHSRRFREDRRNCHLRLPSRNQGEDRNNVAELTLVGVYSDIDRDPRGHIVNVASMTELAHETRPREGSDAMSAEWVDMRDVDLAFDHARILADAKAKLRVNESQ